MKLRSFILSALAAVALLAGSCAMLLGTSLSTAAAAWAHGTFDGTWSVLIVTDNGTCDRAYRYALHIQNGRVFYNDPNFDISGHVDPRGHVNVTVSAGSDSARGSGRLFGDSGQGRWQGNSSTSACSGHWEAQRRG